QKTMLKRKARAGVPLETPAPPNESSSGSTNQKHLVSRAADLFNRHSGKRHSAQTTLVWGRPIRGVGQSVQGVAQGVHRDGGGAADSSASRHQALIKRSQNIQPGRRPRILQQLVQFFWDNRLPEVAKTPMVKPLEPILGRTVETEVAGTADGRSR